MQVFIFMAGLIIGNVFGYKHDEFKEKRMEFLEQTAGIGAPNGYYLQKDPLGQIWIVGPNTCDQVF